MQYKTGDVIKMTNIVPGLEGTIESIIKNHGNSWKITDIHIHELTPGFSYYDIEHTDTNLRINFRKYTVYFKDALKI